MDSGVWIIVISTGNTHNFSSLCNLDGIGPGSGVITWAAYAKMETC